jgi:hypothetical protein
MDELFVDKVRKAAYVVGVSVRDNEEADPIRWRALVQDVADLTLNGWMISAFVLPVAGMRSVDENGRVTELAKHGVTVLFGADVEEMDGEFRRVALWFASRGTGPFWHSTLPHDPFAPTTTIDISHRVLQHTTTICERPARSLLLPAAGGDDGAIQRTVNCGSFRIAVAPRRRVSP